MSDSRTRFIDTLAYRSPSRAPLFEEGIREEVRSTWQDQGLPANVDLDSLFRYDHRIEIYTELGPIPEPSAWPSLTAELPDFAARFNPRDKNRYPTDHTTRRQLREESGLTRILRVHRGFFITAGVYEWNRFKDLMLLAVDKPSLIHEILKIQGECAAQILDQFLAEHRVEAALFSEPIGGNHGPLISPKMYGELILPTYRPVFKTLESHGIDTVIWRTYANTRPLLPLAVEAGINCLWACECGTDAMDYQSIRKEFGPELRLIGGVDLDILHGNLEGIRQAVKAVVPPLLEQGGYLPLLDGRVRKIIPFHKYQYYRQVLEEVAARG